MAKTKKKTVTLEMSVNASFSLKVPKTSQATFEKDLKRGEIKLPLWKSIRIIFLKAA